MASLRRRSSVRAVEAEKGLATWGLGRTAQPWHLVSNIWGRMMYNSVLWGSVLSTVKCLAASLASAPWISIAVSSPPSAGTTRNDCGHCQMSLGGQNHTPPPLRTTVPGIGNKECKALGSMRCCWGDKGWSSGSIGLMRI